MAIAEFPLPSVSGANPIPSVCYQLPERFQVDSVEFDDGGRETALRSGGAGTKTWIVRYAILNQAAAAILDSHAFAAKLPSDGPSAHSFNFRDPKTGTLHGGVRYLRYERPEHRKDWIQSREMTLIKYP